MLWEIWTQKPPWQDAMSKFDIVNAVKRGGRLALPHSTAVGADTPPPPPDFRELLEASWAQDAKSRPNFKEVLRRLRSMSPRLPAAAVERPADVDSGDRVAVAIGIDQRDAAGGE